MRGAVVALAVPLVVVLCIRLVMSTILHIDNRNADHLLKGLFQGVLMYHALMSAHSSISLALFLGVSGRLFGDFATQRDHWKLASTLLGVAFGVLMADVVLHLSEDSWSSIEWWDERSGGHRSSRRRHAPRRRVSDPRRIEELPGVYEELSSIDSRSPVEGETESDREVADLRAQALQAAGQARKYREERKWAWSQGNFARAFQLRWQVKKYNALSDSFTKEADQKLIEADRAKRQPAPRPAEPHYRSDREAPFVQVVVEGGMYESDDNVRVDSVPKSQSSAEHKVRTKTISRITKSVVKLKPGMQVDSHGVHVRSGNSRGVKVSVDHSDAPTSDTWSRQLD